MFFFYQLTQFSENQFFREPIFGKPMCFRITFLPQNLFYTSGVSEKMPKHDYQPTICYFLSPVMHSHSCGGFLWSCNGQIVGQPRKRECGQNVRKMSKKCPKNVQKLSGGAEHNFRTFFGHFLPIWSMLLFGDPVQCSPVTTLKVQGDPASHRSSLSSLRIKKRTWSEVDPPLASPRVKRWGERQAQGTNAHPTTHELNLKTPSRGGGRGSGLLATPHHSGGLGYRPDLVPPWLGPWSGEGGWRGARGNQFPIPNLLPTRPHPSHWPELRKVGASDGSGTRIGAGATHHHILIRHVLVQGPALLLKTLFV